MDKAGGGGNTATRKPAFVATDCLSGPLLTGLSRAEIVEDHNKFFPATFEGDSCFENLSTATRIRLGRLHTGISTGPCGSGGVGDESCHANSWLSFASLYSSSESQTST